MKTTLFAALTVINIGLTGVVLYFVLPREQVAKAEEIFVDHMQRLQYDGQVLRAQFGRSRIGKLTEGRPAPVDRMTVARLVLTRDSAIDLHRELSRVLAIVERPPQAPDMEPSTL